MINLTGCLTEFPKSAWFFIKNLLQAQNLGSQDFPQFPVVIYCVHFLWDMNDSKWYIGFYIQFRQSFAKETFSYDEYLKS